MSGSTRIRVVDRLPNFFQSLIRRCFYRIGFVVGRHPLIFLFISFLLALPSIGLLQLRFAQRLQEGFVQENSQSKSEEGIKMAFDGQDIRKMEKFLCMIRRRDGGNMLGEKWIQMTTQVEQYISQNLSVSVDDVHYSHADFCHPHCDPNFALYLFKEALSQSGSDGILIDHPQSSISHQRFPVAHHLFGVEHSMHFKEGLSSIEMVAIYFEAPLPDDNHTNILTAWESMVFSWSQSQTVFPELRIDVIGDKILGMEMIRGGLSLLPYLCAGLICILIFVSASLLLREFSFGMFYIIGGLVASPLLAVASSFGLVGLLDIPIYPLLLVIPVLILAIGVDNAFLLEHAWRRMRTEKNEKEQHYPRLLAVVLEEFGPSILITSSTNAIAFSMGILVASPANRLFCLVTTLCVVMALVFQITLFASILVLSGHRRPRPSFSFPSLPFPSLTLPSFDLTSRFSIFITQLPVQIFVIVVAFLFLAWNVYWTYQIETKIDSSKILPYDSPLQESDALMRKYFWKEFEPVEVFVGSPPDLLKKGEVDDFLSMVHEIESLPRAIGNRSTILFLPDYMEFYRSIYFFYNALGGNFSVSYDDIPNFLMMGRVGTFWRPMIKYHVQTGTGRVVVDQFKFYTGFHGSHSWMDRAENMRDWRQVAEKWSKFNVVIFSENSPVFEAIFDLRVTTVQTISSTLVAMCLVCFLFIPSLVGVLVAGFGVVAISLGVLGSLRVTGHDLDPVTLAAILMSIGLSVDYTAHVVYHFTRMYQSLPKSTKSSQVVYQTISSVGWPMMQAALSSLICFLPAYFHLDYTPGVFVSSIFLVVSLSLFHSLIVLPSMLSLFPSSFFSTPSPSPSPLPSSVPPTLPLLLPLKEDEGFVSSNASSVTLQNHTDGDSGIS